MKKTKLNVTRKNRNILSTICFTLFFISCTDSTNYIILECAGFKFPAPKRMSNISFRSNGGSLLTTNAFCEKYNEIGLLKLEMKNFSDTIDWINPPRFKGLGTMYVILTITDRIESNTKLMNDLYQDLESSKNEYLEISPMNILGETRMLSLQKIKESNNYFYKFWTCKILNENYLMEVEYIARCADCNVEDHKKEIADLLNSFEKY